MGMFEEFRHPGWNTYYPDRPTPPELDIKTTIVSYLSVVIAVAILMVVAGTRGHERWTTFFRLVLSLHTGVIIVVCNVSQSWQVAQVHSHCEYSLELADGIDADVSMYIGLKSINITLRGNDSMVHSSGRVNYNEEFSFDRARMLDCTQKILEDVKNSYRAALERGLPYPIVYTLEYFRVDSGGFVWQRAMRAAGHFSYIIFWTSLASWFVANILLCFDLPRGLAVLTLTGCLMVTGAIVYHAMQPTKPLRIRFEDGLLIPVYGWAFWLVFAAGILASLAGFGLLLLYTRYPAATLRLFLIDDSQRDVDAPRQLYDYSPGPLKIDTPLSRRTHRRSDKTTSTFGLHNKAFLLDDHPSSSCPQSPVSEAENDPATVAATSDHRDTDDECQTVSNRRSSCYDAGISSDLMPTGVYDADCDRPTSYATTCVVVERRTSSCDIDADTQLSSSNECNIILQPVQAACIDGTDFG